MRNAKRHIVAGFEDRPFIQHTVGGILRKGSSLICAMLSLLFAPATIAVQTSAGETKGAMDRSNAELRAVCNRVVVSRCCRTFAKGSQETGSSFCRSLPRLLPLLLLLLLLPPENYPYSPRANAPTPQW